MLALARLFLILFVVLTVIYASVSIWSRQVRKKKLIAEWREGDPDHGDDMNAAESSSCDEDEDIPLSQLFPQSC